MTTVLFLAANPVDANQLRLDQEARALQLEIDDVLQHEGAPLVLETRWAVEPLDLLREVRRLKPTIVHFAGHGDQHGLCLQGPDGKSKPVSGGALAEMLGAAGSSVRLVVLNACYSDIYAEALLQHVSCVIGMPGKVDDDTARAFSTAFYRVLASGSSIESAFRRACSASSIDRWPHDQRWVRANLRSAKGFNPATNTLQNL